MAIYLREHDLRSALQRHRDHPQDIPARDALAGCLVTLASHPSYPYPPRARPDLESQATLELWVAITKYQWGRGKLFAYLTTVARNAMLRHYRAKFLKHDSKTVSWSFDLGKRL